MGEKVVSSTSVHIRPQCSRMAAMVCVGRGMRGNRQRSGDRKHKYLQRDKEAEGRREAGWRGGRSIVRCFAENGENWREGGMKGGREECKQTEACEEEESADQRGSGGGGVPTIKEEK